MGMISATRRASVKALTSARVSFVKPRARVILLEHARFRLEFAPTRLRLKHSNATTRTPKQVMTDAMALACARAATCVSAKKHVLRRVSATSLEYVRAARVSAQTYRK